MSARENLSAVITADLMAKVSDDVGRDVMRTLSLAEPSSHLALSMAAGGACVGLSAAILWKLNGGEKPPEKPDPECALLAGLLIARHIFGGDPISEAYKDFDALKAAGRLPGDKA